MNENKKKAGLFVPAVLIIVGVAILLQNLGLLGTNLWDVFSQLWPLLLIGLGLNDLIRNRVIVGPVLTIGLGIVFMVGNFSLIGLDSWFALARLWPVLIIAIGLEIFIGRKNIWLSVAGVGFALSILAAGLWYSGGLNNIESARAGTPLESERVEQSLEDAESAKVVIDSSVGTLYVEALVGDDNLIEGTVSPIRNETIEQSFEMDDGEADYRLSSDMNAGTNFRISDYEDSDIVWDLALTTEIPLDLYISLGVGESVLDLSGLIVTELDLNLGVGQTRVTLPNGEYEASIDGGVGQTIVTLPAEGQVQVDVDGGIGEILIRVPEGMGVKIFVDRGIASLTVPGSYRQSDDVYTSPGYDDAENQVELYLEQGIGNIAIREE